MRVVLELHSVLFFTYLRSPPMVAGCARRNRRRHVRPGQRGEKMAQRREAWCVGVAGLPPWGRAGRSRGRHIRIHDAAAMGPYREEKGTMRRDLGEHPHDPLARHVEEGGFLGGEALSYQRVPRRGRRIREKLIGEKSWCVGEGLHIGERAPGQAFVLCLACSVRGMSL